MIPWRIPSTVFLHAECAYLYRTQKMVARRRMLQVLPRGTARAIRLQVTHCGQPAEFIWRTVFAGTRRRVCTSLCINISSSLHNISSSPASSEYLMSWPRAHVFMYGTIRVLEFPLLACRVLLVVSTVQMTLIFRRFFPFPHCMGRGNLGYATLWFLRI